MIYTTLFTAALAISGTAVASPIKNKHPPPTTSTDFAPPTENKDTSLAQWAKHHRKYWGVAIDRVVLEKKGMAAFVAKEFNQVTPENSMKWAETEPQRGKFNFEGADYVVKFAQENNMIVRGHALVWHKQIPRWVTEITDPAILTEAIQSHIANVVGRWKGQVQIWDVVNEILNQDGSLRDSVFSRVLGEDFVRIAFEAAHKADPAAKLYINDFNLDDPDCPKTKGMIAKVGKWRNEGIPITGIGSQSHIEQGAGHRHAAALKALSAAVPEVAITELDITNAPAADYVAVVKGCLVLDNCVGLTSWGANDNVSWLPGKNPLLFDANFRPKKAYEAIMSTL